MNQQNPEPTVDGFFDNVGGGVGAPTLKLEAVNDGVMGTIKSQRVVDSIKFGTTDQVEYNNDGSVRKQLVVILETPLRNWEKVSKVQYIDKDDKSKGLRPPEEDEGLRAVYIPQWSNIQGAIADAVRASKVYDGANGPLRDGGRLGVKIIELRDTGKGNPLKVHSAVYEAPAASATFFEQSAPASQPAPAAQAPAPAATPAPEATPAATPAAQADPWGTPSAEAPKEPPF